MKSQMELALTIGTVIIGAVLLIASLVLSWEMLIPTTDACRIAAGIGYDVGALQSSLFTIPGDVNVHYVPPPICEFASQLRSGSGLICQPLQGGNPNITAISVGYVKTNRYGFSTSGPAYLLVSVTFDWINNLKDNEQEASTIKIKEIATSSPGLQGSGNLLSLNAKDISISKTQTPYGDVISSTTDQDIIERLATAMVASAHNGKNYSDSGENPPILPANWFLTYNSTSKEICEYRIILNSYLYYYNYMADCSKLYPGIMCSHKQNLVNKFGFSESLTSCSSNYFRRGSSIVYYPNTNVLFLISYTTENRVRTYDPWSESNVEKNGTGFLKIRCFNISKLTMDSNISDVDVIMEGSQKIYSDFNSTYRSPNQEIMYKYNATYNPDEKKVTLKLWKA